MLSADDREVVELIFSLHHQLPDVKLELAIIERSNPFVHFLPDLMQVDPLNPTVEMFLIRLVKIFLEGGRDMQFLEFGCPDLQLSFNTLGLFLILSYLFFDGIDSSNVAL